jgi:hypothetical protein
MTPTLEWGDDDTDEDADENTDDDIPAKLNGKARASGKAKAVEKEEEDVDNVGGHEVYMAGDEEADGDAAVYKSATGDEDDNVLFTMPASWNKMSVVLRDSGVLKFVKYVSKAAKGDRWDICGVYGVMEEDDEEEEGDQEAGQRSNGNGHARSQDQMILESSDEEGEFNGFPESEDSDSD